MFYELPGTFEILSFSGEKEISKARWRYATAVKHYFPTYSFREIHLSGITSPVTWPWPVSVDALKCSVWPLTLIMITGYSIKYSSECRKNKCKRERMTENASHHSYSPELFVWQRSERVKKTDIQEIKVFLVFFQQYKGIYYKKEML